MTAILIGLAFGSILRYAKLNRFDTISGLVILGDLTVAKALAAAVGLGAILVAVETVTGLGSFHLKPVILGGLVIGGIVFGTGMAILGYCPGTMAVSLGEGSIDALAGIAGGLAGGLVYTLSFPVIKSLANPDLGSISLFSLLGNSRPLYLIATLIIGSLFIVLAFRLKGRVNNSGKRWLYAGIALAALNVFVNLSFVANHFIGASTAYPMVADFVTGFTGNPYFEKIKEPGTWELEFLGGAFLSGLILSISSKEFRITTLHSNWIRFKGKSPLNRILWSFAGGFLLLFGARMAGGCTSGHILSGGMQLSVSSLVFTVFVFTGLVLTGKLFYNQKDVIK